MTTTLTPPPAPAPAPIPLELDPLRLLPITANLLPPEITDARRAKRTRRLMAAVVCVAVVATAGWYAWARHGASSAQDALTSAQDQSLTLGHKEASYNNLVKVQTESAAISAELTTLMAQDLPWYQLLPALSAIAPAGVTLTSVTGSLTSGSAAQPTLAPVSGPALTVVGTFNIGGTAPDKNSIAAFVDALAGVKGVGNPYLTSAATASGSSLQFSVQADITTDALGGRFAVATPSPTAKASH